MKTRRTRMREALSHAEEGLSLEALAEMFEVPRRVALQDLKHLQLSLRHDDERLLVRPSRCKACGFVFKNEEPKAPSRCPSCRSGTLTDPVFKVGVAGA